MPDHTPETPPEDIPTRVLPRIDVGSPPEALADSPEEATHTPADEPGPAAGDDTPEQPHRDRPAPKELWRAFIRPGRGQLVVGLALFLTGLIVAMTLQSQANQPEFANVRQADLVQLLDNVTAETRRLESEVRELENARNDLRSGADQQAAAEEEAQRRLDQAKILAGTARAAGPGVRIKLIDPKGNITPELMLDAVEELRDAGAEVIEINDSARLVANSWFSSRDGKIVVDGKELNAPYSIEAIGDPATLEAGARFRGGLVSEVEGERVGGQVSIEQVQRLRIDTLAQPKPYNFATPR